MMPIVNEMCSQSSAIEGKEAIQISIKSMSRMGPKEISESVCEAPSEGIKYSNPRIGNPCFCEEKCDTRRKPRLQYRSRAKS